MSRPAGAPKPDAQQGRVPRGLDAGRVTDSPRREPVKRSRSSNDERLLSWAVESHQLEIGRWYAYGEKRGPRYPMLKIRLLDKVGRKGKIKIRFEDGPHPGLEEYVSTRQLVVPWGQRHAVLRDETLAAALDAHAVQVADPALGEATSAVLESTGEPGAGATALGTMMSESGLQRIIDRAGLTSAPAVLCARVPRSPRLRTPSVGGDCRAGPRVRSRGANHGHRLPR
jgi:hypothetical protein